MEIQKVYLKNLNKNGNSKSIYKKFIIKMEIQRLYLKNYNKNGNSKSTFKKL